MLTIQAKLVFDKEEDKGKKLGTFTFDLDRGVFLFHNVEVDEQGKVNLKLISEVPVSLEHLDLLKRSL